MRKKVYQTIQKYNLIAPGDRVVVGVSGGADSLALMHMLYTLRDDLGFTLYAATLDHGLRGSAGEEDVTFVNKEATALGLSVMTGQVDVRALAAEKGMGIESAARLARYNFLAKAAEHFGAKLVSVAHHAGDQSETILMHIIRGSGLHGLGGMKVRGPMPGHVELTLIRPLLQVTRAEIDAYCHEHDLRPRQDVTNDDTTYLRNYIRHKTIPHLEGLNPNIQQGLAQLAETVQLEDDYVQQQLEAFVAGNVAVTDGRITVDCHAFVSLHPALQRRVVMWGANTIRSGSSSMAYNHIIDAVDLALEGKHGAIALLTGGVRLRIEYGSLIIEHEEMPFPKADAPMMPEGQVIGVNIPGETLLPGGEWILVSQIKKAGETLHRNRSVSLAIPEGRMVTLRSRRSGDRFMPPGMGGHRQKLNRWMINRKVLPHLRNHIPLICVEGEIAAIYMDKQWFISEKFAIRGGEDQSIDFHFEKYL